MTLTTSQKAFLVVLTAVCLASLSIAAWSVAKWGFSRSNRPDPVRGIKVAESAEVKVRPDVAFVTFGVVVKNKNAQRAAQTNAARSTAVINAITKVGVPKTDIKTVDYSLEPEMNWSKKPPTITGYTASNSVRVRTKDIAKIGVLIDAAIGAGANNVQGVNFDVEDERQVRRRALTLAIRRAHAKARAMADALGAKLGPATSASESEAMDMPASPCVVLAARPVPVAETTPVEPGELTVSAEVAVVYSIK